MKERIKQARLERGWSQEELARRMSVTQPSVAEWESGRKAPHMKNLMRLAKLLGVAIEWLSTGRGEMHPPPPLAVSEPASAYEWMLPEERRLLKTFARLQPRQREALLGFLESLA
ncbi:MAG: helix-turn-helix domain-containing protein [Gallionella sp.]|nr:helix-turn-helix domain-containing protein [Gallionella sp.]